MNTHSALIQALVYLAASVIAVPIAKRAGLGSVLGYLIAGAVIGPFALHLVGDQADVMGFAEFGVVILLFLIGLEVRPALLWSMRAAIFGLGAAQLIGIGLCIAAVAMLLGLDWQRAAAVGAVLAMSSTAIVLQTLEEKGLRRGAVGSAAFGVLLFQDLAVIPLLVLLPMLAAAPVITVHAAGGLQGWWHALAVLAAVAAIVAGGRYLIGPIFRFIAATRLREIYTATALLLVIGVTALMEIVGISPALGAFLAGVMLAENEFRRELEADIEPFRGLLLGLFFITVGASLDFGLLARHPFLILALTVGLMAVKATAMTVIARAFRLPWGDARTVGVALCQGGEFAFVLVGFVVTAQVLPAELGRMLNAVVAVSMVLTPLVFLLHERFGGKASSNETGAVPDAFDETADVIVAGYGRFGQIAGRLIAANGFRTSVLDISVSQIELLQRFGRRVHYGDAARLDLLRAAGAENAKLLVVAIDDREKSLEVVETVRQSFPHLTILARAWDRRHAYELLDRGAHVVERETFEGGLALGRVALQKLGLRANQAMRASALFRRQDHRLFEELMPLRNDQEGFILASRQSMATLDQLLSAELQDSQTPDRDRGWDTSSLREEMRDAAE
jgi:monovalent cation:proton antiporter-2 (CPA2) family protein